MNVFEPRSRRDRSRNENVLTKGIFPSYDYTSTWLWVEPNGRMDDNSSNWWYTYREKK